MRSEKLNSEEGALEQLASPRGPRRKPSEDGYTMLTVVFLLTLITIWMSVAVPKMTRSIQRDRELETMHRGKQYIRAVQLYYRKFHAYPPTLDALVKTNDIRFLRKKYIDPMTGKDDWKPIMFGQNKQPIVYGFFGQPMMTGNTIAGIGGAGGNTNGVPGLNGGNGSQNAAGTLGSIFNSQQGTDTSGAGATNGTTDTSGNTTASTSGTDANGNPISGNGSNGLSSTGNTSGQTFGGAGIIGVMPASPKVSLLLYKKKDHYNEWEFDYDPAMEMTTVASGGAGLNGTPASNMSNPIGNNGFGNSNNSFGSGQTGNPPSGTNPGSPFSTNPPQ